MGLFPRSQCLAGALGTPLVVRHHHRPSRPSRTTLRAFNSQQTTRRRLWCCTPRLEGFLKPSESVEAPRSEFTAGGGELRRRRAFQDRPSHRSSYHRDANKEKVPAALLTMVSSAGEPICSLIVGATHMLTSPIIDPPHRPQLPLEPGGAPGGGGRPSRSHGAASTTTVRP